MASLDGVIIDTISISWVFTRLRLVVSLVDSVKGISIMAICGGLAAEFDGCSGLIVNVYDLDGAATLEHRGESPASISRRTLSRPARNPRLR